MRGTGANLLLAIVLGIGLIFSLPLFPKEAQSWRGGGGFGGGGFDGFHGGGGFDGGFGGGSFRDGGFGGLHRDRYNNSWNRNVNVSRSYNFSGDGGWGYYGGGGVSPAGAAAVGALAGLSLGAMVSSLPANAQPLLINNQTYYYDGTNYYQPCYGGSDTNYCVVADPN